MRVSKSKVEHMKDQKQKFSVYFTADFISRCKKYIDYSDLIGNDVVYSCRIKPQLGVNLRKLKVKHTNNLTHGTDDDYY